MTHSTISILYKLNAFRTLYSGITETYRILLTEQVIPYITVIFIILYYLAVKLTLLFYMFHGNAPFF